MSIINQTKHVILLSAEILLFLLVKRAPLFITLFVSRLMRKVLIRESIFEKKEFKNFQEYRDFIEVSVKNHHSSEDIIWTEQQRDQANHDNLLSDVVGKKIFFICCDGNEVISKKMPATFLDVWRDTALEAELIVKVSIANEFMYDVLPGSKTKKNLYVNDVINKIKEFDADIVFFDTNYYPNENSLNPKDLRKIKAETKVPIVGHTGDLHNDAGVKCARVWLSSIDLVFHCNIGMADLDVDKLLYLPYTCSVRRYYPVKEKNIPIFFSGTSNIPRLWYILTVSKFADVFLSGSRINFFRSSDRTVKTLISQDEYDSVIRRSFSVLDLTHHSRLQQGTSGRMFQAMATEAILLAEECNSLNKLLKPFVEYLPFRNGIELKYGLRLIRDEPDLCKSIASHGSRKFQEHHRPQKIWTEIIHKAKISN